MARKWSASPKLAQYAGEGEGKGRSYTDPSEPKSRYPSITTVLKLVDKSGMVGWAAGKVADEAIDNYEKMGMQDPETTRLWLRYAHNRFRDERAWVGSGIHATIECEHTGAWDFPELNDEQVRIMEQWEKFNDAYDVEPLRSEYTVLNRTHSYMGTADGLWRITDRVTGESWIAVIDIKTSKNTWPEHELQLAALSNAEHAFQEVDEGTKDAILFKWKNPETGKIEKTYWLKQEAPQYDRVAILHLREDLWDLIEIDPELIELRFEQFTNYSKIHAIETKVKAFKKGK